MPTVMIVDYAPFMRTRYRSALIAAGYDVIEAASAAEALEVYLARRPDGVLLDITMPKADGMAALQQIMKMDPAARVAIVTAMGQQAVVESALGAGASDFMVKPFDGSRVLRMIQKLIS